MDTRSQHLIFDAVSERDFTESDIEAIKKIIETNLTVIKKVEHKFTPQGETIVFILSESHFTIHTYPENRYLSMDIYVCNLETNLEKIMEEIKAVIPFEKIDSRILQRGKIGHREDNRNLNMVYFLTVVVACCSILYEFLLAQSISTTMGNTALRYNLTIGLFIASMGFGALLYKKFISKDYFKEFIKVELILSLVGGVAPILVLIIDYLFNSFSRTSGVSFFSSWVQTPLFTMNHLLIVAIGFLSGLELPLLMDMSKQFKVTKGYFVLAYDYLGTLIGAILFPIVILPSLHIFTIGYVVSLINILVALFVMIKMNIENKKYKFIIWTMLIIWVLLIINSNTVNQLIVEKFYFGGKF
ncbi:MAG: S-adenosylmethionine decarboxylase [Bacteriovorax sp.]|nr:S-adenosylmethionine decarboxylase [Bacteriovorax sp.]